MKYRIFLFDIDGTLIDTCGAGKRAFEKAFDSMYNLKDVCLNKSFIGKTDYEVIKEIIEEFKLGELTPEMLNNFKSVYIKFLKEELHSCSKFKILPGVFECLNYLLKNPLNLLGLGTGNMEEAAWIKLSYGNLSKFFNFGGFGLDDISRDKILKKGVEKAKQKYNLTWNDFNVYVVGDSHLDVISAKKLGFISIAVTSGWQSREFLFQYKPDYLLDRLDEIISFF